MANTKPKKSLTIFLSIVAGIISSVVVFIISIFFFLATGLFGWSDGGDPKFLRRLEFTTNLSIILSTLFALVAGIFVMTKMNKTNQNKTDL